MTPQKKAAGRWDVVTVSYTVDGRPFRKSRGKAAAAEVKVIEVRKDVMAAALAARREGERPWIVSSDVVELIPTQVWVARHKVRRVQ